MESKQDWFHKIIFDLRYNIKGYFKEKFYLARKVMWLYLCIY